MILIENTKIMGLGPTIRGMRNPNDLDLMVYVDLTAPLYWWEDFDTYKVGTVANSCLTMYKIHAKEFTLEDFSHDHLIDYDQYACSEKDMLVLEERPDVICAGVQMLQLMVDVLNFHRQKFLEINDELKTCHFSELEKREEVAKKQKQYWWQMIQLLPSSYNQKRTVMLNYEALANIYQYRRNHKLDEWRKLCEWIEELPYSEVITLKEAKNKTDK